MYNTIILKKGYATLTNKEMENFKKGNTIWGIDSEPVEVKRWSIEDKDDAREELGKYRCAYREGAYVDIEEYALEYCSCDENGEFIEGADYDLADELFRELRNNFDKEICFSNLEDAKAYYTPSLEECSETTDDRFTDYIEKIKDAESLDELADVLNEYTDVCNNGSTWYVREF